MNVRLLFSATVIIGALAIGVAIEELAVVVECSQSTDLDGQVLFLPL